MVLDGTKPPLYVTVSAASRRDAEPGQTFCNRSTTSGEGLGAQREGRLRPIQPAISLARPTASSTPATQRASIITPSAVSCGHGVAQSTFQRSLIQCQAVWATIAESKMTPVLPASAPRNKNPRAGTATQR